MVHRGQRLFVQETDEEGVQCGKTHYKQACLRSGCPGNQSALLWVRTFSVWINLPGGRAAYILRRKKNRCIRLQSSLSCFFLQAAVRKKNRDRCNLSNPSLLWC